MIFLSPACLQMQQPAITFLDNKNRTLGDYAIILLGLPETLFLNVRSY